MAETRPHRRWWVLRALGKNPLVRPADRVEALTVVVAMAAIVLVIPFAIGVGVDVYGNSLRAAADQAQTRVPIKATVTEDPIPVADETGGTIVDIKWTAAGTQHTGVIRPSHSVSKGDQVDVWVDAQGRRVPPPISPSTATAYGASTAAAVWLGTVVLCGIVIAAARRLLNRFRAQAWSAELHVLLDRGDGRTKWPH
ncbi:Rv1733c family protein [Mycolicibacterium sp. XJ870]